MSRILATLAAVLLLPSFFTCIANLIAWFALGQTLIVFDGQYDPQLIGDEIRNVIMRQFTDVIALIPGIGVASLATFKFGANQFAAYRTYLKWTGIVLVINLPVFSLLGVYLLWLKRQSAYVPVKSVF